MDFYYDSKNDCLREKKMPRHQQEYGYIKWTMMCHDKRLKAHECSRLYLRVISNRILFILKWINDNISNHWVWDVLNRNWKKMT